MSIDKYLYEIIDDYRNTDSEEEKAKIFKDFCSSIWGSKNKRRTYTKTIKFKVRNDLLESEIGQIFNAWSEVEYIGYKSMSKDTDWCSLIRQKINNLYTRYFDEEVILKKDYMDLLKTPYNLYYRWIKGVEMNSDELLKTIEDSIYKANELKVVYQKQKIELSWEEYKKIIEGFLMKIFNNCKPIEDYEIDNLTDKFIYELANEDNSYIKCFCNSLEGYLLNYQKEEYGLTVPNTVKQYRRYDRCKECGRLIEIKNKKDYSTKYCKDCKSIVTTRQTNERVKRYRERKKM